MTSIPNERTSQYAWANCREEVARIIRGKTAPTVMEVGAGRSPLFSSGKLPGNVARYTLGDISQSELDHAPSGWDKLCFDVCGDISGLENRFDVVFTRMLAEHVPDGRKFHANVLKMLRPGGVAFHFLPTLYAPPFLINKILPEALSRTVLRLFFPFRDDDGIPKFSAFYSLCYGATSRQERRLRAIGYEDVRIRSFYGHGYFLKIPGLRELDAALAAYAARRELAWLGAYAYFELTKASEAE